MDLWTDLKLSEIARAQQQTAQAAQASASATSTLAGEVAVFRTDVLDGLGTVRKVLNRHGRQVGENLQRIEREQLMTRQALADLGDGLDLLSLNLREGFATVVDRMERMQGTLDRIAEGVLNPEATRALERYRLARSYLEAQMVAEALGALEAARANDAGPPILNIPEIGLLTGMIRMGEFGAAHADPEGAVAALAEAARFAEPAVKPDIIRRLGIAHYQAGDCDASLRCLRAVRMAVADSDRATGVDLWIARGLIAQGRRRAAEDILRDILSQSLRPLVQIAADPVFHGEAAVVKRILAEVAERLRARCRATVRQAPKINIAPSIESLSQKSEAFDAALRGIEPPPPSIEKDGQHIEAQIRVELGNSDAPWSALTEITRLRDLLPAVARYAGRRSGVKIELLDRAGMSCEEIVAACREIERDIAYQIKIFSVATGPKQALRDFLTLTDERKGRLYFKWPESGVSYALKHKPDPTRLLGGLITYRSKRRVKQHEARREEWLEHMSDRRRLENTCSKAWIGKVAQTCRDQGDPLLAQMEGFDRALTVLRREAAALAQARASLSLPEAATP